MTQIEPATEITPVETKPRRRSRWLLWIVLVAAAGYSIPYVMHHVTLTDKPISLSDEEATPAPALAELSEAEAPAPAAEAPAEPTPEAAEPEAAPVAPAPADHAATQEARIAVLEAKLANQSPADAAAQAQAQQSVALLRGQVELLQQQLQNVKQQTQQQGLPVRQLQLWVVLGQLGTAIDRGAPTLPLIVQLREGWVDSEPRELEALRSLAEASEYRIPTEAALLQDFHQLRQDVSASLLQQKDIGLWYRLKAVLREHIRIRRLDAQPSATPSNDILQSLDEAENMLANGEVKGAIELIGSLPQGRTAFESWLSNAQRLINARQSVIILEKALLSSMQSTPLRDNPFPAASSDDAASDGDNSDETSAEATVE